MYDSLHRPHTEQPQRPSTPGSIRLTVRLSARQHVQHLLVTKFGALISGLKVKVAGVEHFSVHVSWWPNITKFSL